MTSYKCANEKKNLEKRLAHRGVKKGIPRRRENVKVMRSLEKAEQEGGWERKEMRVTKQRQ